MKRILGMVTALAALALSMTPAFADSTGPGKNSSYASGSFPLPAAFSTLLSANVVKAKKRTVLVANATLMADTSAPAVLIHQIEVTDGITTVLMQPNAPVRAGDCGLARVSGCTSHGVFWLDVDANPSFIGKPLTINMRGGADFATGIGSPGIATLSVTVEKK
jgi:hypothetical protein